MVRQLRFRTVTPLSQVLENEEKMSDEEHIQAGHIRVRCEDKMCFWVHPIDLKPASGECYDPEAFDDPLPCEHMSHSEWILRQQPRDHRKVGG
jgi:hypothetical protein